jgi:hypothetical protein
MLDSIFQNGRAQAEIKETVVERQSIARVYVAKLAAVSDTIDLALARAIMISLSSMSVP